MGIYERAQNVWQRKKFKSHIRHKTDIYTYTRFPIRDVRWYGRAAKVRLYCWGWPNK